MEAGGVRERVWGAISSRRHAKETTRHSKSSRPPPAIACTRSLVSSSGRRTWLRTRCRKRSFARGNSFPRCAIRIGSTPGSIADREQLERGFSRLKPEQRAVVVLHYYSGFSAAEIARMLGIPEGTARSRLRYATEAMRAALEADARQPAVAKNRTA